jgi:hypothetical protein
MGRVMGFRDVIRSSLIESFKHRLPNAETACAACGVRNNPLAFHVYQYAQPKDAPFLDGFVPMSASGETLRGTFPLCEKCAPPCRWCGLPTMTNQVRVLFKAVTARLPDPDEYVLLYGNGRCTEHIHILQDLKDLVSATFSRGSPS